MSFCYSNLFCIVGLLECLRGWMSRPDSRSDPIGRSEPSSGSETIYWDSYLIFFFKAELVPVGYGPTSYNRIKISNTYQTNYHRSGVHQNLYPYTESHLQIKNCTFTITNQSAEPTCSEPLLVCWPSNMRKYSDVFSCTYTD